LYQFSEDLNHHAFFWFRKCLVENGNWAMLSTAAKAIYPVLACHTNKNGVSFPNENTIAALSGVTEKIVRQGVKDLEGFPGFHWESYVTKKGRRAKKFNLELPKEHNRGENFPFHQAILESGNWRELRPTGKALYIAMRYYGYFDLDEYAEREDVEYDLEDLDGFFANRRYDFCEAEKYIMAKAAGINRTSVNAALCSLEHCHLADPLEDRYGWKIYLRDSGYIFKRSYLNERLMTKKYRS
jgi:hypothetical protein